LRVAEERERDNWNSAKQEAADPARQDSICTPWLKSYMEGLLKKVPDLRVDTIRVHQNCARVTGMCALANNLIVGVSTTNFGAVEVQTSAADGDTGHRRFESKLIPTENTDEEWPFIRPSCSCGTPQVRAPSTSQLQWA